MKIIEKKLDEIIPYEYNPRRNDDAVEYVANSIKEFGFKVPIIIDANGIIVAGHTRLKAAKQLGMTTVPCIVADDLTDDQIKAFRIADNKVAEFSNWDWGELELELEDIELDMSVFGFDPLEEINIEDFSKEREQINLKTGEYLLIIDCENEDDMQIKYEKLQKMGIECRTSTL